MKEKIIQVFDAGEVEGKFGTGGQRVKQKLIGALSSEGRIYMQAMQEIEGKPSIGWFIVPPPDFKVK